MLPVNTASIKCPLYFLPSDWRKILCGTKYVKVSSVVVTVGCGTMPGNSCFTQGVCELPMVQDGVMYSGAFCLK